MLISGLTFQKKKQRGFDFMSDSNYEGITVRLHNENMDWWLKLPTTAEELQRVLSEIGTEKGTFKIDKSRDSFDGKLESVIEGSDLSAVNYLSALLEEFSPAQLQLLDAVMESSEHFERIGKLIDFAQNTSYYELYPDVRSREDLAKHYIQQSGLIQMPEEWVEGIDLEKFGANLEKHEAGSYTSHGYLIPTGMEWTAVFERDRVIPEEYRLNQNSVDPVNEHMKPVYSHSVDYARQHNELDLWRKNIELNGSCAKAIDQAVRDSNYELYHYDLEIAAKTVIEEFGMERVGFVLAAELQSHHYDGRYSQSNKEWVQEFDIQMLDRQPTFDTHPTILDGFVNHFRRISAELEKQNPLAAAEMSKEQNYNMLDGRINNEAAPKADLTDGQTLEEIRELAPETLPKEKASVVERTRDAREQTRSTKEMPEKKHKRNECAR